MPIGFWLMIAFFVLVGFMLVNNAYWSNVRYEHVYRRRRHAELAQQRQSGQQA
ncbi:MAG: hypothetical protein RJA99_902 [Pseudomonadota bacterium]